MPLLIKIRHTHSPPDTSMCRNCSPSPRSPFHLPNSPGPNPFKPSSTNEAVKRTKHPSAEPKKRLGKPDQTAEQHSVITTRKRSHCDSSNETAREKKRKQLAPHDVASRLWDQVRQRLHIDISSEAPLGLKYIERKLRESKEGSTGDMDQLVGDLLVWADAHNNMMGLYLGALRHCLESADYFAWFNRKDMDITRDEDRRRFDNAQRAYLRNRIANELCDDGSLIGLFLPALLRSE